MDVGDRSAGVGRLKRAGGDCSGRVRFPVIAQVMMTFG
jgi:hypothetical protein